MPRIINGNYYEDGNPRKRVINTNGGDYIEKIEGDVVVVSGQTIPGIPKRKDLSKDGKPAIDVDVENN